MATFVLLYLVQVMNRKAMTVSLRWFRVWFLGLPENVDSGSMVLMSL